MTTWPEHRKELEFMLRNPNAPDYWKAAIRACLARLDAAELALDEARTRSDEGESCAAYAARAREAGRVEAVAEVVKYVRAVADARKGESMPRAVFKTLHGAADAIEHKFKRPDRAKGG